MTAISYGLLSLLNPQTAVARWIGYQILYGAGTGAATSGVGIPLSSPGPLPPFFLNPKKNHLVTNASLHTTI